jgi:hypothetical protein
MTQQIKEKMMAPQPETILNPKKPYASPALTVHGDVTTITLGDDLGEDVDAAFTTTSITSAPGRGKKKPKRNQFS